MHRETIPGPDDGAIERPLGRGGPEAAPPAREARRAPGDAPPPSPGELVAEFRAIRAANRPGAWPDAVAMIREDRDNDERYR